MAGMDTNKLEELISDAGFETRRYSGRSMYGAECVGFESVNPIGDTATIVNNVGVEYGDASDDFTDIVKAFQNAKTDDLGLGTIIYFPKYKYPKG